MDSSISRITTGSSYIPPDASGQTGAPKSEDNQAPMDTFKKHEPSSGRKGKSAQEPQKMKEYTILAYEAACNNLEDSMVDDVKEMENHAASDNFNVVVQLARYHTSPLTAEFLTAALSQAFKSREFNGALQEIVPDNELVEKYGELLKDPYVCGRISTILLRRNPALQDRLDKLVEGKVREASKDNKDLNAVLQDTMIEMLTQVVTKESERESEGAVKTLSAGLSDIFEDDTRPLGSLIARTAGEFINETEGSSKDGMGLFGSTGLADAVGGRRGSVLFADTPPGSKYNQGDYNKYLGWVDGVKKDNEPQWRGVKRFQLAGDDDPTRINSKPVAYLGHADMSKKETLANFIIWGMNKYPAKHFMVILSDHGAGFLGAEEDRGNMLSLSDLREAFEIVKEKAGKTPDILAFDCCLMAQAEVASELKNSAKYLIASEEVIGGDGYPYREILPSMDQALKEGKTDPRDIASLVIDNGKKVNEKSTFTLAAIDLSAADAVVAAVDQLASHILEGKADLNVVKESLKMTQHFNVNFSPMQPYDDFRDLGDLADKLDKNPRITNGEIKQDLKNLKAALKKAVVNEQHRDDEDYQGTTGMSIYAPRRKKNMSIPLMAEYEKTTMGKSSKWTELIKKVTDYDELLREAEEKAKKGESPKLTFIPLPERPV